MAQGKTSQQRSAEARRAAGYRRKQKWKQLPGKRYTPDQLRKMSDSLGPITIVEVPPEVMHLK